MKVESNLKTTVVRKIEKIPPQDWNSVFPRALENYYFFKSIDESNFEQFSFFYIVVYDNGVAIGTTSCFLMRFALDMTVRGPLKLIFDSIKKLLPNILCPKVLVCGLPMGMGRIGIARDSDRVMRAIYDCMEKIAKNEKASMFIFKDFTRDYDDIFKPLLKKGFSKVESLPSTDIDVSFISFDEYLKTLSRTSREGLKRNFKKVDGKAKIDLEVTDALEDNVLPQVYGLYLQTHEKRDIGLEKVPMDFFKNVSRNMPKEVKYFLWRIEGKVVAFAFCLVSGEYFIDYYLGFDYSVAHEHYLYFVRFRDLMKWCITHGIKKYEMGATSYEAKRRLGFNFIRLYFYMKHRNPLLNPFFNIVSHFMKPENFDPVFKEMKKK
ncbi:MAG: GNAT family N-acetyltransferase [Candidatus Omnitrophota bacterium]|nr:GNAT family N-acetyltransferase [Candidatus Omnitrophota bacterium]